MNNSRWWHIAIGAATLTLVALVLLFEAELWRIVGGIASAAVFALGWMAAGRFARHSARSATAFALIVIVISAVGTASAPVFAFIQFIAYPIVWLVSTNLRNAITWNLALTVALAAGFVPSVGATPAALAQTFLVQLISLGFSLAFGFWITSISTRLNERQSLLDELASARSQLARGTREFGVDRVTLPAALDRLADQFARRSGIVVTVTADSADEERPGADALILRCAQEALANVRKHSDAATVHLALTATPREVALTVSDDGTGFDATDAHLGRGLSDLSTRLGLVGGTLTVRSSPGAGVTVRAAVPRA